MTFLLISQTRTMGSFTTLLVTQIKWGLNDTAKANSRILRVSIARNKISLKSFERYVQF